MLPSSPLPLPPLKLRFAPLTTLKLRKHLNPLPKTLLTLGADYNTQLGVWQFRSDWEDKIIGGRISLRPPYLTLSKTWLLSVGGFNPGSASKSVGDRSPPGDIVTRLRLRASVDIKTLDVTCRLGFRTERGDTLDLPRGFRFTRSVPLDGRDGHAKVEVKANVCVPEPEVEWGTGGERERGQVVGMGDVEVGVEEINFLLEY